MKNIREGLYEVIFEAETKAGKNFDILLVIAITLSVLAVLLESVEQIRITFGAFLWNIEWFFTILFTTEYFLRIWVVRRPMGYIFSFYGIIDLLSIIPTYLTFYLPGAHFLIVIRIIRLLRLFRVLKLIRYLDEAAVLITALKGARHKITVFLSTVLSITVIMGAIMYVIEGPENGFNTIPHGIYWSIVTICTVGFGDIAPATALGRFFASILMITGYAIIAIPTGIFSSELIKAHKGRDKVYETTRTCPSCTKEGHDEDADYCKYCGDSLE